jgi:hypothetical protein
VLLWFSNMNHMTNVHGLFIPDIEYVRDLAEFIRYLGEKVSVGNVCLYCNGRGRQLHTLQAVQSHMVCLSQLHHLIHITFVARFGSLQTSL